MTSLRALTSTILLFASSLYGASEDPLLREILKKHFDAMGGLSSWHKVESIQLNGTIERDGQTVDIVVVKKRPNQIRATVTVPVPGKEDEAFQIIRAHDGKTAWTATRLAGQPEMTQEELPEEAASELLADAGVLPPLIKLWRSGAQLDLIKPEPENGSDTFAIRVTSEEALSEYTFYLSKEDYLINRYECNHPVNGTTITELSDYTTEQNIRIPTLSRIEANETGESVMATESIKIGVGIYGEYFEINNRPSTADL